MAGLASPGLGSGLDINSLITKLMAVEQQPLQALAKKEASYQAKLSAYGTLKGYLSTFQTSVQGLTSLSQFNTQKATSSDSTVLAASASGTAATGSYSISVETLAQNHKLRSGTSYATTSSTVGTGTLTIDFGTYSGGAFTQNSSKGTKTITIDSSQNTLTGVRDAVNAANAGVSATIVNDGTGYRLMLTSSDSGAGNALRIVADAGISALAYDASTGGTSNLVQTQTAQDATLTIDGIAVTKSSNTITDAIEGVTLSLLKGGSSTATLSVTRDTAGIRSAVDGFVKAFNDASTSLKNLTAYNATTKTSAILQGDSTTLSIQSQLRSVLNTALPYANGGLTTLSDLGISFRKNGTLSLDFVKLDQVLADSTKNVSTLFAAVGKPTDSLIAFTSSTTDTQPGVYAARIKQIATQGGVTGSAAQATQTTINSGNNGLSLTVNGVAADITLSSGTYSNASLLATLQAAINGATALSSAGITVTASMNGTQASVAGSAVAGLTITAANKTFDVTVDSTTATVTLDEGTYTAASLASALQSKINADVGLAAAGKSVSVSQANGALTVKSNRYGATSGISFAASAATTNLFGGTPAAGTGTGTSTITLTSDQYGAVSNVNVTAGTGATALFGAATLSGTAGKDVAGTIFNTSGLTKGNATGATALSGTQTVNGTNNVLSLKVDGTAASVTLDSTDYTVAQLAAHIQTKINADAGLLAAGISVSVAADSSGKLVITSNNYGSGSTVTDLGGSATTAFIGTATTTAGSGTVVDAARGYATGAITLTGSNVVVTGSNDTLSVTVDGASTTVALNAGTYTDAELATEIQTRINVVSGFARAGKSVTVTVNGSNQLVITSNSYGPSSSVSVGGGTAADAFVGTATSTAGTGTATGFGQSLTAANGDGDGLKLTIGGGVIGARGTVAFDQGFAYRLDQTIADLLATDGTIASRTDGITRSITDIGTRRETLTRRLTDIEARYRRQFNALDSLVASMQQTSSYLSQQLATLSSSRD